MRRLLWSLLCKHEYRVTFFRSPIRAVLNLTCARCGQERIELLAPDWDKHVYTPEA